jgi:carboxyl-terminal processing protease
MSNKNNSSKYFILITVAVFFGMVLGATYQQNKENGLLKRLPSLSLNKTEKVAKILKVIKNNYVDSINTDSLEELAINDILNSLDPHTIYLPPIEAKNQNESLEGNFEGIGIEYYILNDTLFVTHVRKGGPSFKAGLKRGDKIITVNQEELNTKGLLTENIVNKLRGKRGSKVNVTVKREGIKKDISIDIIRDKITVSSIDASFLLTKEIGYIKISRFGASTATEFEDELTKLKKTGINNLILDLRGNGGGYLSAATAIADQFLPENKLIVFTKGLHEPRTDYTATANGMFENGKLIILVDEGTASASEIVAGAIQDLDRGTIIGRRSFGKGLVQEQFAFEDGSAMNLTVARYYTPSGRSIQKSYSNGKDAYYDEINKRFNHGDYSSLDSSINDTLFIKAVKFKTAKGRTVYSAGGILPDIFIALDTTMVTPFFKKVTEKGLINEYVYNYLTKKIKSANYANAADFVNRFNLSPQDYNQFLNFCNRKKIEIDLKSTKISKQIIAIQIEALLAKFYFGDEGFYRAINADDDFVVKAIQKIKNPA